MKNCIRYAVPLMKFPELFADSRNLIDINSVTISEAVSHLHEQTGQTEEPP